MDWDPCWIHCVFIFYCCLSVGYLFMYFLLFYSSWFLCFVFCVTCCYFFFFFLNCDYSYFRFYIELEIAHCLGVIKDGFLRWDFMG